MINRSAGGWIRLQITDNTSRILNILRVNKLAALHEAGKFGVSKMDEYVPVDTGYLKSRNDYRIRGGMIDRYLELINQSHYSGYVEMGTRRMKARPFMRPALYNHVDALTNIVGRNLAHGLN